MTNETKDLLEVIIKSGQLQINYVENIFKRLGKHQKRLCVDIFTEKYRYNIDVQCLKHIDTYRRHKRQINPLYVVGDIADWTFGETNIIIVVQNSVMSKHFAGLVSHDHLEQFKTSVENNLSYMEKQNEEIHEYKIMTEF